MKIIKSVFISLLIVFSFVSASNAGVKKDVTTCGADPTGATDSASAIQSCINAGGDTAAIYFPSGNYTIGSTITIPNHGVTLYTDAYISAKLTFTGCGEFIKFRRTSGGEIFNGGMRNLWLFGDGHCAQTGLLVHDGSWLKVEDVLLSGFSDSSGQSIGIKTNGREGFHVRDVQILADNPIVIDKNPNYISLAADHFHFENVYTSIPEGRQNWHYALLDQVTVSNTTIDGQNPMAGGCGILKWVSPTSSNIASFNLKIANTRFEQMEAGCDKQIYIDLPSTATLQSLIVDNVLIGPQIPFVTGTAIYLRSVDGLSVRDTKYFNAVRSPITPATFIDAGRIKFIELQNNHLDVFSQAIVATDASSTALVWKTGPFRGKECCYFDSGTGLWTKSADSGVLAQP